MLLVREIMYCKPGKVKPLVQKFIQMNELMAKGGWGKSRIMTDSRVNVTGRSSASSRSRA